MEYHEIGERFEFNGVELEVIEGQGDTTDCISCYFRYSDCIAFKETWCNSRLRSDKSPIYYKRVEQCKPKDMKQETEIKVESTGETFATHVTNIQSDEEIYGSLLDKLFKTYKAKDADYGSAFAEMFDELGIDYAYGKLREKMNRIKVLRNKPNMVENEGLEDALLDTAGYAILTLVELKKRKNGMD